MVQVVFNDGTHGLRLVIDFFDHVVREAAFALALVCFHAAAPDSIASQRGWLPLTGYGQSRTGCISSTFTALVPGWTPENVADKSLTGGSSGTLPAIHSPVICRGPRRQNDPPLDEER